MLEFEFFLVRLNAFRLGWRAQVGVGDGGGAVILAATSHLMARADLVQRVIAPHGSLAGWRGQEECRRPRRNPSSSTASPQVTPQLTNLTAQTVFFYCLIS